LKIELPDDYKIYPDEEFIQNLMKAQDVNMKMEDISVEAFEHLADKSLEYMGTVGVKRIPKEFITGVYVPETYEDYMRLIMACDPSISPLNYLLCKEMYIQYLENLEFEPLKSFEKLDYIRGKIDNFLVSKHLKRK
jgi:hypothetical protein